MVPKKGLEPPHPCGYMDLNHARLPIPPLRQVNYSAVRAALKEDTAASILTRHGLSVKPRPTAGLYERAWPMQIRAREAVKMSEKPAIRAKTESQKSKQEAEKIVVRLRALAHDLSNSLEAIMQASYLLGQARLEGESKRWAQLLESSSEEAARINREMRKLLRSLSGE
jgi:K+-sensing histidine kinase KdpD